MVPGVTPVALGAPERTAADLLSVLRRIKGTLDPGLEVSAVQAADLAHRHGAALVAVVEHPGADPALLVAVVVPADRVPAEHLLHGPSIREVTEGVTATGHPVVIIERIPVSGTGAQLQVVVTADGVAVVFTLHSPTGRGWLDVSGVAGRFVSGIEFSGIGRQSASRPRPGGTSARSARR
ncbi:hypothetical protein DFJ66_7132 [Saccharothrix variisporea]|uniref:Uncharacterized protein n=1 Tax=Saccharothrix variisporea TaxID=543527 RepID=A0A495XKS3_9PSEU|nr:hypothetical protein DFJ66_7132 [Saccharothrix variisporea]